MSNQLKPKTGLAELWALQYLNRLYAALKQKILPKPSNYTSDLIGTKHVALGSDFDGAIASVFDVTGLPLIVEELLKLDVSESDIRLIMGENVRRVLLENLPDEVQ